MNQYQFALRNVVDKLAKVVRRPATLAFYGRTYLLSPMLAPEPAFYLVSYPKCGRTWLRFMLAQYLALAGSQSVSGQDKRYLRLPDQRWLKFEHDQGSWIPAPPRIERLSFQTAKYAGHPILFMVRDPRDVLISSWYHLKYRERIYSGPLADFIRDELVGIHKVIAFMNMWLAHRHVPAAFLLLTYEQMHQSPQAELARLLDFIGLPIEPAALEQAVAASSFERMKRVEQQAAKEEPWLRPGAGQGDESLKIRRGQVGAFRQELSPADIAFLDEVIAAELSPELPYHPA